MRIDHLIFQLGARFSWEATAASEQFVNQLKQEAQRRLEPVRDWLEQELHSRLNVVYIRSCFADAQRSLGPTFIKLFWRLYWKRGD